MGKEKWRDGVLEQRGDGELERWRDDVGESEDAQIVRVRGFAGRSEAGSRMRGKPTDHKSEVRKAL